MASTDDAAVIAILKSGTAKINDSDGAVSRYPPLQPAGRMQIMCQRVNKWERTAVIGTCAAGNIVVSMCALWSRNTVTIHSVPSTPPVQSTVLAAAQSLPSQEFSVWCNGKQLKGALWDSNSCLTGRVASVFSCAH
jgi:hypothetical protein